LELIKELYYDARPYKSQDLQEGLYRKRKSFRSQPFYPLKYLDIIKTYITMNKISCKIF